MLRNISPNVQTTPIKYSLKYCFKLLGVQKLGKCGKSIKVSCRGKEKSIIFLSLPFDFFLSWISSLKVAWHRSSVKRRNFSGRKREFTFLERDCITSRNFSTFSRDKFAMKNNECRGFNSFSFRLSPRRRQAFAYYFRPLSNFYVWFIILKLKLITLLHTESATLLAKAIISTQHSISQLKLFRRWQNF